MIGAIRVNMSNRVIPTIKLILMAIKRYVLVAIKRNVGNVNRITIF